MHRAEARGTAMREIRQRDVRPASASAEDKSLSQARTM